jgi:hypothetical protein
MARPGATPIRFHSLFDDERHGRRMMPRQRGQNGMVDARRVRRARPTLPAIGRSSNVSATDRGCAKDTPAHKAISRAARSALS